MKDPESITRVLLVDDDEDDAVIFRGLISRIQDGKFEVEWAPSYPLGLAALRRGAHDVCFFDYRLGVKTGLDLLREALAGGCRMPIILLTGHGEHDVDLQAMREGAADYLVKDQVSPFLIERSIRYSIHRAQSLEALREREAQVLMQDRLASVGLLASSLAHEIGTPLGVIRGRAEFLALQLQDNEPIRKNADIIIQQIDRVSKLIRSLLNLARGDQTLGREEISLTQVVEEVLELMAHELSRRSIDVRNELSGCLPIRVSAEAGPLHQVLLNLLVNSMHAVDAAKNSGRPSGHFIRLSAEEQGTQWVLSVEDSGCGISLENMRNLFKPFFTTKDIGVGTGLGLATSYRIIESWGGSIVARSQLGVGTTFQVSLPKSDAASASRGT
jgi:signal transduction histidine kinase